MTIKTDFKFGDIVYIKHDPEQKEYEVVGILARPGSIQIEIDYLGDVVEMYDFQLSHEKDPVKVYGLSEKENDD